MKRAYSRPKISRVKLIAEEAVLTACKTTGDKGNRSCTNNGCVGSANQPS